VGDVFESVSANHESLYTHNPKSFIDAMRIASLTFPAYPVPLGVYYQKPRAPFTLQQHVKKTVEDLPALYQAKASWQVG
jgi:2-oxoglutarate/2-oxoacid ferredoxin oxidoreductase subunit beta